jgi:hypothetical protein
MASLKTDVAETVEANAGKVEITLSLMVIGRREVRPPEMLP